MYGPSRGGTLRLPFRDVYTEPEGMSACMLRVRLDLEKIGLCSLLTLPSLVGPGSYFHILLCCWWLWISLNR
jgi:hypothetical protein